ncbi:MAG: T9SS type A sorting domain-containing protein, partial [Sphingobacteriales bacterium]|nr:T9SS type A sorting domain-containing protein [Sphingobacteriales bacterium]
SANMISIRILDISGRLIYSNELPKGLKQIELNSEELNMKRGVYWIIIEDKFQIHTLKVLKE